MKNIYLTLQGRIGNQLFQYALARKVQLDMPRDTTIVICDYDVMRRKWVNSLMYYNLPNVRYTHEKIFDSDLRWNSKFFARKIYRLFTRKTSYINKFKWEKRLNTFLGNNGMFICENGYIEPRLNIQKDVYLEGYFQSLKYFESISGDILNLFDGEQFKEIQNYPNIDLLRNRNSVCISVKVEHNVGSSMYDVCSMEYWKKGIDYIVKNVENPVFFICSDNTEFVLENLIDAKHFEYVVQSQDYPVHVSLAAMAECKHYIIGNTTFGWWAQYLSKNKDKIVIAPSKWMAVEMPIDIYLDGWHLIDV